MSNPKKPFIETLFVQYGGAVRRYIYKRVRTKADVPDLAQEVYLRILRISDTDAIRNPQNYLYTVASNVLRDHAALQRRRASDVDLDALETQRRLGELPDLEVELEASQNAALLRSALDQLPSRWRTALILQSRYDLTYEEIGDRLGVSSNMVKKYLAKALGRLEFLLANLD